MTTPRTKKMLLVAVASMTGSGVAVGCSHTEVTGFPAGSSYEAEDASPTAFGDSQAAPDGAADAPSDSSAADDASDAQDASDGGG